MKSKKKIFLYILLAIFNLGVVFQIFSYSAYYKMEKVSFYNLNEQELNARYHKGTKNSGVIIVNDLEDNARDSTLMAKEFINLGYSVYIFDLPSQGLTAGNLKLGYKQNTYIAEQYYTAVVAFSQLAKLNQENIHVVASGAAARAVLQTATKQIFTPKDITLIGVKTNILKKVDFDVINFVREEDVSFMKKLSSTNPGCKIHLITSNLSSSSSVAENEALEKKLETGGDESGTKNEVKLDVIKFASPINMIKSGRIVQNTVNYVASSDGGQYSADKLLTVKGCLSILLSIIAFFIIVLSYRITNDRYYENKGKVKFSKEFVIWKLIAIVPAYILVFVIPVIIYFVASAFVPFPYFELLTFSLIASYGLVVYYLYKKTDFAGDLGKYIFYKETKKNIISGLTVAVGTVIMIILLSISGSNIVMKYFSYKTLWLVIFGLLCSFLFFVEEREKEVLIATQKERYIMSAFNFAVFLIVAILLLVLGRFTISFKYFALSFYVIFVLAVGKLMKAVDSPTWLNALVQSFMLCSIILAKTVLFF